DLLMDEMMMGGVDVSAADGNRTFSGVDAPVVQRPHPLTTHPSTNGGTGNSDSGHTPRESSKRPPYERRGHENAGHTDGARTNGQQYPADTTGGSYQSRPLYDDFHDTSAADQARHVDSYPVDPYATAP